MGTSEKKRNSAEIKASQFVLNNSRMILALIRKFMVYRAFRILFYFSEIQLRI
jgi:hypothetical protein